MSSSCFLPGHRDAPDSVLPALTAEVARHITEYGVTEFLVGHYGRFDRLAAKAVIAAKRGHPEVRLVLLLPYHPGERPFPLPEGFDGSYYPPGMEKVPRRFAIIRANRLAVDSCDYLIAYFQHIASNTRELVEYALRRQKKGRIAVTLLNTDTTE